MHQFEDATRSGDLGMEPEGFGGEVAAGVAEREGSGVSGGVVLVEWVNEKPYGEGSGVVWLLSKSWLKGDCW
ncbi:hypothetical protein Droror1_Dr00008366 [Drosera rotundifolia]